jgi:pSer/pThr/pTyr-binding forkhead associated (FHA) protein
MRIGREPDNEVVVSDLGVSRHHAELRRSDTGSYELVDLGSHNGTFVNGRQISSAVLLTESDIVSIGQCTFHLAEGELRQLGDSGDATFKARDESGHPDT